ADSLRLRLREADGDESSRRGKHGKFCDRFILPENISGMSFDFLSAFLGNYLELRVGDCNQKKRCLRHFRWKNRTSSQLSEVTDHELTGAGERRVGANVTVISGLRGLWGAAYCCCGISCCPTWSCSA